MPQSFVGLPEEVLQASTQIGVALPRDDLHEMGQCPSPSSRQQVVLGSCRMVDEGMVCYGLRGAIYPLDEEERLAEAILL